MAGVYERWLNMYIGTHVFEQLIGFPEQRLFSLWPKLVRNTWISAYWNSCIWTTDRVSRTTFVFIVAQTFQKSLNSCILELMYLNNCLLGFLKVWLATHYASVDNPSQISTVLIIAQIEQSCVLLIIHLHVPKLITHVNMMFKVVGNFARIIL